MEAKIQMLVPFLAKDRREKKKIAIPALIFHMQMLAHIKCSSRMCMFFFCFTISMSEIYKISTILDYSK